MPLTLRLRRGRAGRLRFLPTYSFVDWRLVVSNDDRVVYHPGLVVYLWRLGLTAVTLLLAVALYWGFGRPGPPEPPVARIPAAQQQQLQQMTDRAADDLRQRLTDDEWAAFQRRTEARRAERLADRSQGDVWEQRLRNAGQLAYRLCVGTLLFIGAVAPLSCLWNRLVVERAGPDRIRVRAWLLWPTSRDWPLQAFDRIAVEAREQIVRGRYGRQHHLGWYWYVCLRGVTPDDEPSIEFCTDRERRQPDPNFNPPTAVTAFVAWLARMTKLPVTGPEVVNLGPIESGWLGARRRVVRCRPGETSRPTVRRTTRITVRDAEGREQTFASPDDMPPNVREIYKRSRRPSDQA